MKLFSVFDKKANCFFPPFTCENKIQAIRGVSDTVNTAGTVLNKYPEDFSLFYLGDFDSETGKFVILDMKYLECECLQLVAPVRDVTRSVYERDASDRSREAKGE